MRAARFPVENLPTFSTAGLRQTRPADAQLEEHQVHVRRPTQRRTLDLRHVSNVAGAIQSLPEPGESLHLIAKGNSPFYRFIPRIIELAGEPIADLKISTLSFGRDFAEWLLAALDSGDVGQVGIACSTYFRATCAHEFSLLATGLKPPSKLAVVRTHAKVIACRMASGRGIVAEGSSNLRGCRMTEQAVITHDAELCRFHHKWITDFLNNGTTTDAASRSE